MKIKFILKLSAGLAAFSIMLAGCSGGTTSETDASTPDSTVTGVATPSKVSVVNTN